MKYAIVTLNHGYETEEERFETDEEAVDWVLDVLPHDDTAYGILNEDINDFVCIVYQGREWHF